jgi:hypothetical protein
MAAEDEVVDCLSKILKLNSGIVLVSTKHSDWYQRVRDRSYCGNRAASQLFLQAATAPSFPPSLHSEDLLDCLEIVSSIFTDTSPQDELFVRQLCSFATLDASRVLSYLPTISQSEWHSIIFDICGGYLSEPSVAIPDVLSYLKNKDQQDFDELVGELESQLSPLLLNYHQPHQELLQQLYITILPFLLLPVTASSPTAVEDPLAIRTSYMPTGDCVEQLQALLHQNPCRLTNQQRAVYFGLTAHRLFRNSDAEAALDFYQLSLEKIKHHKAKETELSKSTNLDSIVETCALNISRCFEILSQLYFGAALQMPIEVERVPRKGSPRCSCNA